MRCERVRTPAEARALAPPPTAVEEQVRAVLDRVRAEGDAAVAEYERRWPASPSDSREVPSGALETAIANVRAVAEASLEREGAVRLAQGHEVRLRAAPVRAAGIYAPGGRAPYPSSVIMGVVAARAAGVEDVAVCSPHAGPLIERAAELSGATRVHSVGGAQAIAALAYGTESIAPVDVIAGPGNPYVTEAKRQVFGHVGIDGLAGPSDVCVAASADADPEAVALDLLAQAEHGPGTLAVAVSPERDLLGAVERRLAAAADTGAIAVLVEDEDAVGWADEFAPEHLELLGAGAEARAGEIRRAGCVFVGTGTAFGDYVAGSNHTLPTGGAARWASGLSPAVFRRRWAEVRIPPAAAAELAPAGAAIARAEGFERHAESMEWRMGAR